MIKNKIYEIKAENFSEYEWQIEDVIKKMPEKWGLVYEADFKPIRI